MEELCAAFEEAVDDYLETCEKAGIAPQRPYSGKVMLRTRRSCMPRLPCARKQAANL